MTERRAYLLMLISIPILWYGAIWLFDPKPVLFPPLDLVGRVLFEERMELLHHTWTTLKEAVIGYAFANVLAIGLAVSFLYVRWFESFCHAVDGGGEEYSFPDHRQHPDRHDGRYVGAQSYHRNSYYLFPDSCQRFEGPEIGRYGTAGPDEGAQCLELADLQESLLAGSVALLHRGSRDRFYGKYHRRYCGGMALCPEWARLISLSNPPLSFAPIDSMQ